MNVKLPMMIALRGYAVPLRDGNGWQKQLKPCRKIRKTLPRPSDEIVIFDTETTTNHEQRLRIGTYQVRKAMLLHEKGIFYEPGVIASYELALLYTYASERGLKLRTREEFVREVLYLYGYDHGGLILGFNLPFDLSRLATKISTSHGKDMRGGFSLEMLPKRWRPNILVKHLNSRTAFMRFAAPPGTVDSRSMRNKGFKTRAKTGYFQDVKTLAAALLGKPFSLASLAKHLGTAHQKMETDEHGGPLTPEYLDYALTDVDVTWECYVELLKLYNAHGLTETPPHRIYSEASLGKAYLRQIRVEPWGKMQPDFSPELLGIIMSTYYGGRAEVRIRRQIARVLYCDFRSMYPTVCTLMGLWPFVIATGIDYEDWTDQARTLLAEIDLEALGRPDTWPQLTALVQVAPEEDVFPVRAYYGETSRTIGLNYLSAGFSIWYTLADCIASKLLTGKAPRIMRAIRFTPRAPQTGFQPIAIGGDPQFRIDPGKDDFYKRIIELRGQIQSKAKRAGDAGDLQNKERLDPHAQMLKLLANSTSYGIFAEMNVQSYDRPRQVACHGVEHGPFQVGTKSVEEPGTHFHPLLATLITGAARLMLAIAERLAADNAIGWAFCDTDSLALARPAGMADDEFLNRAIAVTHWFDALNPYDDDKPLFKIEDQNYRLENGKPVSGEHEPLYAFAISAKRYVLFNLDEDGKPIIRKALAHGLGHLLAPYSASEAPASIPVPSAPLSEIGVERWQYDLWYQIVLAELEGHPDQVGLSPLPLLDRPAASRYSASTPTLLRWFKRFNEERPWENQVRAFNFMLAYQVSPTALYAAIASGEVGEEYLKGGIPAAVAPFNSDTALAAGQCFDRNTKRALPVSILSTYREAIADYHIHSELKFGNGEVTDRGVTRRRHIQAVAIEYIGKEANRWEDQFYLGELLDAQIEYGRSEDSQRRIIATLSLIAKRIGVSVLAAQAGITRQEFSAILSGVALPRLQTIRVLIDAAVRILRENG